MERLRQIQRRRARLSLAQHAAEGGMLGKVENESESRRDGRVLTAHWILRDIMPSRLYRLIAIGIALVGALTFNVKAQQAVLVNGNPALRFDNSRARSSYAFVERVITKGEPSLSFSVVHFHIYTVCVGHLYVSANRVVYSPTAFLEEGKNSHWRISPSRGYAEDAFDLPASEIKHPVEPAGDWVKLIVQKKTFRLTPLWDPMPTGDIVAFKQPNKTFYNLLVLALNDFPAAEREFQRLTAGLDSEPASKAAASSLSPPSEAKTAKLLVSSDPQNAQVYINGELKGTVSQSGLSMALPAGVYQLRVALAGYRDFTHAVTLAAGDNKEMFAQLERAGPPPLGVTDVIDLLKGGVSPKRVAALVQQRGVSFVLDDDSEQKIRDAGGDAELLLAISKAKK